MSIKRIFIFFSLLICFSAFSQTLPSSNELLESYKKNPNDNNTYFQYGIALSRENKDTEAIIVFEKLLTTYPQSSALYNNLAVIYARQKNFDKTEELLKNAIKYSPNYDTAYENIADLYAKLSALNYQRAYQISKNNTLLPKIDGLNKVLDVTQTVSSNNVGNSNSIVSTVIAKSEIKTSLPVTLPTYNNEVKPASLLTQANKDSVNENNINSQEINQFLNAWKKSWEDKDLKTYLSFYDMSFISGKTNYSQWSQQRTKNIGNQQDIQISLSEIKVNFINNETHVKFIQSYKSKTVSEVDQIDYVVRKINNQWKFIKKL